jgi:hypothetical protein
MIREFMMMFEQIDHINRDVNFKNTEILELKSIVIEMKNSLEES